MSEWPDVVNGSFEMLGSLFILASILKVLRDRDVKGVSPMHAGFFAAWGLWNLYFYPWAGAWWSFWGGVGIVTANTVWLVLLIRFGGFRC